jgi:hypothetical protein
LTKESYSFVKNYLPIDVAKMIRIELETVDQSKNKKWFAERKKRLTASNFGTVVNRRKNIYPTFLLKKLISNRYISLQSQACRWGNENEDFALEKYKKKYNCEIIKSGLVINPKWPWLGCSPDGLCINNDSYKIIEIKCPFSKRHLSVREACNDKNFCMELVNDQAKTKNQTLLLLPLSRYNGYNRNKRNRFYSLHK